MAAAALLSALPAMASDMVIEPAEPDEYVEIPERGEVVAEDGGERLDALQPQVFLRGGLWSQSDDLLLLAGH